MIWCDRWYPNSTSSAWNGLPI